MKPATAILLLAIACAIAGCITVQHADHITIMQSTNGSFTIPLNGLP